MYSLIRKWFKPEKPKVNILLEGQLKRVKDSYKELQQAEQNYLNADKDYIDLAVRQYQLAIDRSNNEIALYKQLEREFFHERIAKG